VEKTRYTTERIDHLGIVAGMCNKIGLIETIDEQVGESERKVSVGQAVQAMVLNGLGFVGRPLYLTPEFFANKPVELLISPDIQAAELNDDSLGRALDCLFESGVTEVFARVASRAVSIFGVEQQFRHLDSTTFTLHGQYERAQEETAVEITHGYSKDHRPDLKQVVLSLICTHQSAIPTWLGALDGNQQDKHSFPEIIQAYREQLEAEDEGYFIADSALYSADNLATLSDVLWLTRVPATLKAVKQLYQQVTPAQMHPAGEPGYRLLELCTTYGQVRQRWVVVYSQAAYQREVATLQRRVDREYEQATKALTHLTNQEFETVAAAQEALEQLQQAWQFHRVRNSQCEAVPHYHKPGRPRAGQEPDYLTWRIEADIVVDEQALAAQRQTKGKFVLATNQLNRSQLPAEQMLSAYKREGSAAERGFRFLKDPLFFADSLFLEKPARIMALLMIMGLSLLIYALAEYHLRQQLRHHHQTIPNQLGKPTARPTMRRIFQIFEGIDILTIRHPTSGTAPPERLVLNLSPLHQQILALLGPEIQYCYQP
jgi:transposase